MKLLLVYGTTEGHTRKIAGFIADRLRHSGDQVDVLDATEVPWDLLLLSYDAVIVAASVHNEHYQTSIVQFARQYYERLNKMPSLFLSVSLSAASQDTENMRRLVEAEERLRSLSGWNASIQHVAGAIRFSEYDFFRNMVVRMVALRRGVKGATANSDLELTDWDELGTIVDQFRMAAANSAKRS